MASNDSSRTVLKHRAISTTVFGFKFIFHMLSVYTETESKQSRCLSATCCTLITHLRLCRSLTSRSWQSTVFTTDT